MIKIGTNLIRKTHNNKKLVWNTSNKEGFTAQGSTFNKNKKYQQQEKHVNQ